MRNIFYIPAYTGLALMLLGISFITFVKIDYWMNLSSSTGFEWVTPLLYLVAGAVVLAGASLASVAGLLGKLNKFHRYLIFMSALYLVCYFVILYFLWERSIADGAVVTDIENLIVWSVLFALPSVVSIFGSLLIKRSLSSDNI